MSAEVPQTGGGEGPAPVLEPSTVVEEKLNPEAKDAQSQSVAAEVPEASNHVEVAASANTEPISPQSAISNGQQKDWEQKEAQLLQKIQQLEGLTKDAVVDKLKTELKVREEEVELLKARVSSLETELQAALAKPGAGKNQEVIDTIKKQHEELLTKARGMIFDKTKMVKNQELQIEALNTQVQSLKDINQITKDLLEIRNAEMKAMEDRLSAMEARFKAEKERHALVLKRTEASSNINGDLKKEYETQLALFKELRVKYDERVQALVAENTRLKELKEAKEEASG